MTLDGFLQQGLEFRILREVDVALLRLIQQHQQTPISDEVCLAILLVSKQSALGHACIDLAQLLADPLGYFALPDTVTFQADKRQVCEAMSVFIQTTLAALALDDFLVEVQTCDGIVDGQLADIHIAPLVVQQQGPKALLYLRRYWHCEQQLVAFIGARVNKQLDLPLQARTYIQQLFAPVDQQGLIDWQRVAVALAARSRFAIITGGPGTGKTTTVLRLLALLQAMQLEQGQQPLHIKLAAPTGKAAARLNESIAGNLQGQAFPASDVYSEQQLRDCIPTQVTTLHRLLGSIPNSRQFRHHQDNPVAADVVVVDEASMVDVEMMAALVQALDSHTRLILIGDKDQLASVEAGSVLGDLCEQAAKGNYLPVTAQWLQHFSGDRIGPEFIDAQASDLSQVTAMLRVSHRFKQGGAIHALASLVNEGLYEGQPTLWPMEDLATIVNQEQTQAEQQQRQAQLQLLPQGQQPDAQLQAYLVEGYRPYLQLVQQGSDCLSVDDWGKQVLQQQSQFQLLVALRQGLWGLAEMNNRIQVWLQQATLLPDQTSEWYAGRPVMVTRNDYHLKLMNGDVGVCLPYPDVSLASGYRLRVVFSDGEGGVRWVLPSRLRAVETVFAMTVHKSQGSEFDHTLLMLPEQPNPVLTKELLYTGITRAKAKFTLIYANQQVLADAMQKCVQRVSGLVDHF